MNDERRMTIVEHLQELRRVLIISLVAWFLGTVLAFIFNGFVLDLLLRPLKAILQHTHNIVSTAIFTSPTEGLTVPIKVASPSARKPRTTSLSLTGFSTMSPSARTCPSIR